MLRAHGPTVAVQEGRSSRSASWNPGQIITTSDLIAVRLERRAYTPVLRKASLPAAATIPWRDNRTLRYELI